MCICGAADCGTTNHVLPVVQLRCFVRRRLFNFTIDHSGVADDATTILCMCREAEGGVFHLLFLLACAFQVPITLLTIIQ
jgi:hypothetical protein